MAFVSASQSFLVHLIFHGDAGEAILELEVPWSGHQVEYQAKHYEHHGFQHDENHTVPIEPKKFEEENIFKKNVKSFIMHFK